MRVRRVDHKKHYKPKSKNQYNLTEYLHIVDPPSTHSVAPVI